MIRILGSLGISCFEKEGICKTQPKSWDSFLHIPSPTWADLRFPYARGLIFHQPFMRELSRLTNYNFHPYVQYCITIQYLSCSIDKYRNVKDVKCHNCGRLGISHLENERFCKIHPKGWESFLHIPSPTWTDLRFPYARGLRYHHPFMGTYQNGQIITVHAHVQYCTTIHYLGCSIDKYRNVKYVKCCTFVES